MGLLAGFLQRYVKLPSEIFTNHLRLLRKPLLQIKPIPQPNNQSSKMRNIPDRQTKARRNNPNSKSKEKVQIPGAQIFRNEV